MSFEILKDKIKNKEFDGLFYIYGDEEYLKDYYYRTLKKKSVSDMREFNVHELSGVGLSVNTLENIMNSFPLMGDTKFVGIVDLEHDLLTEDYKTELLQILSDIPSYACVVFYDTAKKGGRDSVLQGLIAKAGGLAVEINAMSQSQLAAWGKRQFKSEGKSISNDDIYYLLRIAEKDMLSLRNEIRKIASYSKNETVSRTDIDAVVTKSLESNQFALGEALAKRDFKNVMRIIEDLYALQYDHMQIANLIYRCLIDLLRATWALSAGKRNIDMKKDFGIHEYGATKMMRACKALNEKQLFLCVDLCYECDVRLKRESGDKKEMIYQLVCQLIITGANYED